MEITKFKTAKVKGRAVGFMTFLVVYGKLIHKGIYKLELVIPFRKLLGDYYFTIYKGTVKPKLHNLYVIGIIWFPFYCILSVLIPIVYLIMAIIMLICSFYLTHLSVRYDDVLLKISGYISFILSIIGVIAIVKWLI